MRCGKRKESKLLRTSTQESALLPFGRAELTQGFTGDRGECKSLLERAQGCGSCLGVRPNLSRTYTEESSRVLLHASCQQSPGSMQTLWHAFDAGWGLVTPSPASRSSPPICWTGDAASGKQATSERLRFSCLSSRNLQPAGCIQRPCTPCSWVQPLRSYLPAAPSRDRGCPGCAARVILICSRGLVAG